MFFRKNIKGLNGMEVQIVEERDRCGEKTGEFCTAISTQRRESKHQTPKTPMLKDTG